MIWDLLCFIGRHDWRPVFRHVASRDGSLISLVRCYRVRLNGAACGAERYRATKPDWKRGGQL